MLSLRQDVRYALRIARDNPWSTAAAILALTIGIGATVTIFTVVNGVMLLPLPVKHGSQLVRLFSTTPEQPRGRVSMQDYLDWKRDVKSFDQMALFRFAESNLNGGGKPQRVKVLECESSLLPMMGLHVLRGRNFTAAEDQPGNGASAMLSRALWQSRFGGQNVLGKTIWLNDKPYMVTGILPEAVNVLSESPDVAIPVTFDLQDILNTRGFRLYQVLARLRPGVPLPHALGETASVARILAQKYPKLDGNLGVSGMYLHDWMVFTIRPALIVLFAAVCAVLLIACGNIANLLLVRASARKREMSVRIAVGANHWRLVRQLLTECLLLSFTGAALGLALAAVGVAVVKYAEASHLPHPAGVAIDWRVAAFTVAVAVFSSMLFGLAPAFNVSRTRANDALKELSGRVTESRGNQNIKRLFVAAATAIAALLLIESGLLIKTFSRLVGIEPGFDPHNVITMRLALPTVRYDAWKHPGIVGNFVERLRNRIETIPGVEDAGFTADLPLLGAEHLVVQVRGKPAPRNWPLQPPVRFVEVSPNYFKTMRIPMIEGRGFNDRDDNKTTLNDTYFVAIVNQTFARQFLRGQDPVGSLIRPDVAIAPWFHVVGVVHDFHQDRIDEPIAPAVFTCLIQQEETQLAVVARVRGDPLSFVKPITRMVHDADPSLPVYSPMTMEQLSHQQLGWRTFHTSVLTALAAIALLLAAIGIYAVAAYSVASRTAEIGVRMALGAQRSDIARMILWNGTMPAVCGTLAGAAAALLFRHMLAGLLYGITATDLSTYAGVVAFLILVSIAATLIPAIRAASIDPSQALRYQ